MVKIHAFEFHDNLQVQIGGQPREDHEKGDIVVVEQSDYLMMARLGLTHLGSVELNYEDVKALIVSPDELLKQQKAEQAKAEKADKAKAKKAEALQKAHDKVAEAQKALEAINENVKAVTAKKTQAETDLQEGLDNKVGEDTQKHLEEVVAGFTTDLETAEKAQKEAETELAEAQKALEDASEK